MKCPCENCICLPVCRHKKYYSLFIDCSLIKKYIPNHNSVLKKNKDKLEEIMKPTYWSFKNQKGWVEPLVVSHK